jgi:hypothetical protein
MSPRVTAAALAAAALALACACRKSPPVAVVDASAPADVAVAERPFAVVAEGPFTMKAVQTSDGRIVLIDGPTLYEAKPDGTLTPLLSPAAQAALVPDDESVVGYSTYRHVHDVHGALAGTLVLDAYSGNGQQTTFTLRGGKVTQLASGGMRRPKWFREHVLAWDQGQRAFRWADGADLPVPQIPSEVEVSPDLVYVAGDGSLIALARARGYPRLFVWGQKADPQEIYVPEGCLPIGSFTDRFVLSCAGHAEALVDNRRLERIFDAIEIPVTFTACVGLDGAVYVASKDAVTRCLPNRPCTAREIPKVPVKAVTTYDARSTEFVSHDRGTRWDSLAIEPVTTDTGIEDVQQIFARGPNDVWVLVHKGRRTQVLHTSPPPSAAMMLPTATEASVLLRNQRPPATWTSACDQVFVRIGSDADAITKRATEIEKALRVDKDRYPADFTWALVEGKLGEQRGVGVILARRNPSRKIEMLEAAANRLVEAFETGGANRPSVYCTLPVLERKLLPAQR